MAQALSGQRLRDLGIRFFPQPSSIACAKSPMLRGSVLLGMLVACSGTRCRMVADTDVKGNIGFSPAGDMFAFCDACSQFPGCNGAVFRPGAGCYFKSNVDKANQVATEGLVTVIPFNENRTLLF